MIWSSFLLAVAGWGVSLAVWYSVGFAAGVHPGFIMALSVGITFTITCCQSVVMPDKARLFALGVETGVRLVTELQAPEGEPEQPRRRLSSV